MVGTLPQQHGVRLRFYLPPADLRPMVTTIYQMVVDVTDGETIDDRLHPEWANLRLIVEGSFSAAVGDAPLAPVPRTVMVGPTCRATRFSSGAAHIWGIGLMPLGWARLTDAPASEFADRFVTVDEAPEFERLMPFDSLCREPVADPDRFCDVLVGALREAFSKSGARDDDIVRIELALVDPALHTVGELAASAGMSTRTLERVCKQAFGFSPQLLLRRQRFLRSLAQFMLDPSLTWIETLDSHYYDQAHFVRDFKYFMGMSPTAYARLPHPVLGAAAHARKAVAGEAVQVLHRPLPS